MTTEEDRIAEEYLREEENREAVEYARESLVRLQEFNVSQLPRKDILGKAFHFEEAVEPAQRLVDLFSQLSPDTLADLGKTQLDEVTKLAGPCLNLFEQVLQFDVTQTKAHDRHLQLIQQIRDKYKEAFTVLHPLISYSLHKTADFKRLESETKAVLQRFKDDADSVMDEMNDLKSKADNTLELIRATAVEKGVTQQAIDFKSEADQNQEDADTWRSRTNKLAWALGGYAVLSLFVHKLPWLGIENTYDVVQLAISKVLIFTVISYMLYLSAKNFLSHKHNTVVNRHRQNALQTYTTLVEASGDSQTRDAVLLHAAACIYSPQPTGYSAGSGDSQGATSVIELMSKPLADKGQT